MSITRAVDRPCNLCGAAPDVMLYDDGSIRSVFLSCGCHIGTMPADPPFLFDRGQHWPTQPVAEPHP